MDTKLVEFEHMIHNIEHIGYLFIGLSIVFLFFLIYIYLLVQEKKKLRQMVEYHVNVFHKALDISNDPLLILSDKNEIVYANAEMVKFLGLEQNFINKTLMTIPKIKIKNDWILLDQFVKDQYEKINQNTLHFSQLLIQLEKNKVVSINLYIDKLLNNSHQEAWYYVISMQDLTLKEKYEDVLYKHPLTNVPNQLQALRDFPALYSKVHIQNNKIALILLSFDNFTRLRSIIGYEQANEILIKFVHYLNTIVKQFNVSVYHTFDNHFLLTVSNLNTIDEIKQFVEEIQIKLASSYKMEDASLHLTVSAGISIYPDSGSTRLLLDNAYKALYQAQKKGDGNIEVYLPKKISNDYDELTLHNDMQGALDRGEFEVYFQPIVRADTHDVVSAEALIRWIHPKFGFIPPDKFISLMEKTGFIIKLGQFILDQVLKQQKRWELFKFKQITVSINVSMVEIATGQFVQHVDEQMKYHKVDPRLIKFEITEGMAMIQEEKTEKYFTELKKLGVGILLDDFGTGYTSFGYLKKFPADIIKIDKSLVDYILVNEEDQRIVKAMIELGHNLGMKIVVEGVESKDMVHMLTTYGCDFIQGYYFSKPLPVFEFQKMLR